ncbi:ABC transporter permease [Paenibacillus sacheonensis]|uniref:ABC transporter permease n=1 Tax=Paenibacillus sacheonensis TaxID=742054 RepID=A0A7X4YPQ5_9BACL|nr:ABC-2 family transporter protein [Paenibacillus sacheonensis]MBM7564929.1 ABC-2 type transport system permease protein [Paenibacillus sacheonensis]NBC70282.1 hypothetical protein [Paenibacillus sacheonensis]
MNAYLALTWMSFKNRKVYKLNVFFRVCSSVLLIVVLREIWTAVYGSGASGLTVTLADMLTYSVIASIIRTLIPSDFHYDISQRVQTGDIVLDLQKPWSYLAMTFFRTLADLLFGLVYVVIPIAAASLLLFPIGVPTGAQAVWFVLSGLLGYGIAFSLTFLVGLLAFLFTEVGGFGMIKSTILEICSGAMIPLWLFPAGAAKVLELLPFQGVFSIPISIYIGKLQGAAMWHGLELQLIWAASLLALAQVLLVVFNRLLVTTGG